MAAAGGAEAISRGAYLLPAARWGARMGDAAAIDDMLGILQDPFHKIHMGITAENVAAQEGITREKRDALALQSQQRAIAGGRFAPQIVALEIASRKGTLCFDTDEHVRGDVNAVQLDKMKPALKANGSVTAGNASGLNDGAAALLLATDSAVRDQRLNPLARLVGYAHAGVNPTLMGLERVPATPAVLKRTGLSHDLDVIERTRPLPRRPGR